MASFPENKNSSWAESEAMLVAKWGLEKFAELCGDSPPDETYRGQDKWYLPSCCTHKLVYETYMEENRSNITGTIASSTFSRMWNTSYPNVKISKVYYAFHHYEPIGFYLKSKSSPKSFIHKNLFQRFYILMESYIA